MDIADDEYVPVLAIQSIDKGTCGACHGDRPRCDRQVQRSSIAVGSGCPGAVLTLGRARSRHLSPGAGSIPSNQVSTGSRMSTGGLSTSVRRRASEAG